MIAKRRGHLFGLGLIASAMMLPWALEPASAADAPEFVQVSKDVKLRPKAPVSVIPGSPINARLTFRQKFASITSVCFRFVFQNDLLDPGDQVTLDFGPNAGGVGFLNPGSEAQDERTICSIQPEVLAAFLDGKQEFLIAASTGSVTIASVTATVIGYERPRAHCDGDD